MRRVVLSFLLSVTSYAKEPQRPLNIAAIWSKNTGSEYLCVIRAMLKDAKQNSVKINLQTFDYNNSVSEIVALSEQIAKQGFDVVIGPRTSQEALAAAPAFNKAGVPQVLPVASHSDLTEKFSNTVRVIGSSEAYARKMAYFIQKNMKAKRIVVVTNLSAPFSTYYKAALPTNLAALGSKALLTYIDIIDGNVDYKKISHEIIKASPDLVYAPLYDVDLTSIYSKLLENKFSTKIVTHAGLYVSSPILREHLDPSIEIFYNGIWDGKFKGANYKNFQSIMQSDCKMYTDNVRTVAAYDAVLLALEIGLLNSGQRTDKIKNLKQLKIEGILGNWKNDSLGGTHRSLPIYKLTKSKDILYKVIP